MEEVRARVNEKYNIQWEHQTVSTFLMKLEKKGALEKVRKGRVFYYTPLISEKETRDAAIKEFTELWEL